MRDRITADSIWHSLHNSDRNYYGISWFKFKVDNSKEIKYWTRKIKCTMCYINLKKKQKQAQYTVAKSFCKIYYEPYILVFWKTDFLKKAYLV